MPLPRDGPGHEVCVKLMSCRLFHTTNYSLHTLLPYKFLPCTISFKAASSLGCPAVEQYSFEITGSCVYFLCLEVREMPTCIRQYGAGAESRYF